MTRKPKPAVLPCPFCGSTKLTTRPSQLLYGVECKNCNAVGPSIPPTLDPEDAKQEDYLNGWNMRAQQPAPRIPCEFPGCTNEAAYEGWYRKRDQFLGTPTGHIVRIAFCESCKSHPHLCANEPKSTKEV